MRNETIHVRMKSTDYVLSRSFNVLQLEPIILYTWIQSTNDLGLLKSRIHQTWKKCPGTALINEIRKFHFID